MCLTTFHYGCFYSCSYEKEGRLTVTDHSKNLSRTYEGTTDIIPAFLSTDFSSDDHIHVGGLPGGVMVSKFCRYSWTIPIEFGRQNSGIFLRMRSVWSERVSKGKVGLERDKCPLQLFHERILRTKESCIHLLLVFSRTRFSLVT